MDDELLEHIGLTAEKGTSRGEIRKLLLQAGWPSAHVNEYIEKTFKKLEKGVIIRVHGLTKTFGEHTVLQNVNFDIRRGEIFGIIGMSGVGKTTLLNLLVNFLKPDYGVVLLALPDGTIQSVFKQPGLVKRHIGFSTQTPSFYNKLTVRENLEHFATLYDITELDKVRRCNALMDLVDLKDSRDVWKRDAIVHRSY